MTKLRKFIVAIALAVASLLAPDAEAQTIRRQEQPTWCWAAAIQDVLALNRQYVPQAQIAAVLRGAPLNTPARPEEVAWLLNRFGRQAWPVPRPATPQELYATLAGGHKIIALVNPGRNPVLAHFVVFEGVGPNMTIVVADPADGSTRFVPLQTVYYGYAWMGSVVVR